MDNILKRLRDEANFTQEEVAEKLEVTVNTIQNWERTGKLSKESLHSLLELYDVDRITRNEAVLAIFGDNNSDDLNSDLDNFPYFLFENRPDIVAAARNACLSSEEMEVFGYTYYLKGINASNESSYSGSPRMWPIEYAFLKDHGGYYKTMNLINSIENRVGRTNLDKPNLMNEINNYGLNHLGTGFRFVSMPKPFIAANIKNLPVNGKPIDVNKLYSWCCAVKKPVLLKQNMISRDCVIFDIVDLEGSNYWHEKNSSYKIKLEATAGQGFAIDKKESTYSQLKREQYLSDKKAYDAHPDLYDRKPSFDFEYEYWLRLTQKGEQYIEWYES